MLNFISIKDMSNTTKDYPRNVSISYGGKDGKITLLGNLSHGTELSIDEANGEKLINLIQSHINGSESGEYKIEYKCYKCGNEWEETYSCPCDSECGVCDARNVQALKWEEIKSEGKEVIQ